MKKSNKNALKTQISLLKIFKIYSHTNLFKSTQSKLMKKSRKIFRKKTIDHFQK